MFARLYSYLCAKPFTYAIFKQKKSRAEMPYFFLIITIVMQIIIVQIINIIIYSYYFIFTLMLLLLLKLLFICTLARSLGVSISNNSSDEILK